MRNRYLYCICLALILLWGLLICPIRDSYHSKGPPEDYAGRYIDVLGVIDKLEPKSYGDYYIYLSSITFRDEGQKGDSAQINPPKGIVCIIQNSETFDSLKCGMQLEVRGKYVLFDEPSNPGEFNLRNYYRSLGMEGKIKSPDIAVIKAKYPLQAICYDLKRNLKDRIEAMYEGYTEGIMTALLVGDKENLPEEVKDSFKASGVSHILAISSLHVSFLGMALFKMLRKAGVPNRICAVSGSLLMIAYCMVIDGSLSAVRAVTMFVIHMAGVYLGRTYDVRTALCFAGLLCVIDNPQVVYNGGFWLSYGCVMSVVGIPGIKGLPKPLSGAGVTISIFAGTLPILLWFYYEVSPWGLVLNILVIPLISLCLAGGILGILLPSGLGLLGMGISFGVDLMVKCVCFLCGLVTKLGAGTFITGKPGVLMVALYYCLLLLFVNPTCSKRIGKIPGKIRRYAFTAAVFLILLFSGNHQKKVTFLDVGQGDGAVILKGKEAYLIDGGSSSVKSVGKNRILPYLKYEGVREIKTVLLSHPDEDHLNGSAELIKECKDIRIDSVCISECIKDEWISKYPDLLNACLAEEIRIYPISTGYRIRDGDLTITCIYPENDSRVTDTNSGSEVLFVEYGKEVFLFTGDLDKEGENRVAAFLSTVKGFNGTDFLKVSHHGSRYSTYAPFLETVNPKFSVISVGRNSYGHPARETLERLSDSGSRCLRTDICGALTVTVGRNKTKIRKFKK